MQWLTGVHTMSLFQPLRVYLSSLVLFHIIVCSHSDDIQILRMCVKWLTACSQSILKNALVLWHIIISANRSLLKNICVFCHVTACRRSDDAQMLMFCAMLLLVVGLSTLKNSQLFNHIIAYSQLEHLQKAQVLLTHTYILTEQLIITFWQIVSKLHFYTYIVLFRFQLWRVL
jgi:hypothetical protein